MREEGEKQVGGHWMGMARKQHVGKVVAENSSVQVFPMEISSLLAILAQIPYSSLQEASWDVKKFPAPPPHTGAVFDPTSRYNAPTAPLLRSPGIRKARSVVQNMHMGLEEAFYILIVCLFLSYPYIYLGSMFCFRSLCNCRRCHDYRQNI